MSEDSTIVFTNIHEALGQSEREARGRPACLLVIGGDLNGTLFDLKPGISNLGRSPDNEIPLEFTGISRKHMSIIVTIKNEIDYDVHIQDASSRNGTFLNNKKLEESTLLKKGDIIKVGNIALKFIPSNDPERVTYDKLNFEANNDGLTKCYNKTYFNNKCDLEVRKCKLTGDPLSLILFDLDHFKKLNDTYGHDAGDFVLKELSELIRKQGVREGDIFARYGGEEFVILLPKTTIKNSYEIAERLRLLIEQHSFMYDNKKLPVTSSIGIADYRKGVDIGVDLFKRADEALYKSKSQGRNQVTFYQ